MKCYCLDYTWNKKMKTRHCWNSCFVSCLMFPRRLDAFWSFACPLLKSSSALSQSGWGTTSGIATCGCICVLEATHESGQRRPMQWLFGLLLPNRVWECRVRRIRFLTGFEILSNRTVWFWEVSKEGRKKLANEISYYVNHKIKTA